MNVIKKSYSGYQLFPLDAALLLSRRMFLEGPITTESVGLVLKQLLFLEGEDETEPIRLFINSPGGSVSAGLTLYWQLKAMTVPVDIIGIELCASMAAILLAGGKPGHRALLKGSRCMIHEPLLSSESGGISGKATEIRQAADSILKTKDMLDTLLAADTGHTLKEIRTATSYDHFMTDQEALDFRLVDTIIDRI